MYRHTYRQQQMETYEYSLRFLFNTYIHMYIDPQMTHIQIYVCMDMCSVHTHTLLAIHTNKRRQLYMMISKK